MTCAPVNGAIVCGHTTWINIVILVSVVVWLVVYSNYRYYQERKKAEVKKWWIARPLPPRGLKKRKRMIKAR